jgi:nucleoside-diphosphate-sugar epimerase
LIIELSGKKGSLKPVNVSPRIGEVDRLIANAGKANEILEWTPKIGIKEGLNTFIQQYKYFGSEERITL